MSQAMDTGVRALPILSLITFFNRPDPRATGSLRASQIWRDKRRSHGGRRHHVPGTRSLDHRDRVIGRSGSAFAAEIGTMKVSEEIDALETMAISPIRFLVAPKFLAMMVMLPCLTIWANAMGILGGSLFGVAQADFTFVRYIRASIDSLLLRDITTGLIKSVMFAITITAVGCLEGLRTAGGAEQVGRSTTRAVVMSIFLVVLVDLFFTTLFFFLGGR